MELIVKSDSDAHSSDDKHISLQSDIDCDNDTHDITDQNIKQWADTTNCQSTLPVVHRFTYRGSRCFMTEARHINKDPSPLSVFDRKTRKTIPRPRAN
jgi:hypothetical protein